MDLKIVKTLGKTRTNELIKELLYRECNSKTVLFLSGGSTPKTLYESLARDGLLKVGAVAMIDERYGGRFHPKSNELMIKDTGFLDYLGKHNVKFYPILESQDVEVTANDYDQTVRLLLNNFPKAIGILGIGKDGHTAGIAPNRSNFTNPVFADKISYVSYFNDKFGEFGERVTMTFEALENLDKIIIMALGEEKEEALRQMQKEGSLEEIPSRFYMKEDVLAKTILFTDQKV